MVTMTAGDVTHCQDAAINNSRNWCNWSRICAASSTQILRRVLHHLPFQFANFLPQRFRRHTSSDNSGFCRRTAPPFPFALASQCSGPSAVCLIHFYQPLRSDTVLFVVLAASRRRSVSIHRSRHRRRDFIVLGTESLPATLRAARPWFNQGAPTERRKPLSASRTLSPPARLPAYPALRAAVLIPTRTSNSPRRKSRMISSALHGINIRVQVTHALAVPSRYSVKSSAIRW